MRLAHAGRANHETSRPRANPWAILLLTLLQASAACSGSFGPPRLAHQEKQEKEDQTMQPQPKQTERAYLAGGCFWGVEYYLEQLPGVLSVTSGYMGGHTRNPTYADVCSGTTGHVETVEVRFDATVTDFKTIARRFFEIHDPTQLDRQGPDVGEQYRSVVFYTSEDQKKTAQQLIAQLKARGYAVVTRVVPATHFWPAEDYHQDYYRRTGKQPYCHIPVPRFAGPTNGP